MIDQCTNGLSGQALTAKRGQITCISRSKFLNLPNQRITYTMSKREGSPPQEGILIKRAREESPPSNQIAISSAGDNKKGLIRTVKRTSGLEAPIVSLSGAHSVCCRLITISTAIKRLS